MTLLELNTKKNELLQTIWAEVDNPELLAEISDFVQSRIEKKAPCQYSPEQLRDRALLAIEQMQNGEGTPHEEMKKRFTA